MDVAPMHQWTWYITEQCKENETSLLQGVYNLDFDYGEEKTRTKKQSRLKEQYWGEHLRLCMHDKKGGLICV